MTKSEKPEVILPLPNQQQLRLIFVKGVEFKMGSNDDESEQPIHHVRLTDFFIGQFSVTQAQWLSVDSSNPSRFMGLDRPVDSVSHEEVLNWLKKLRHATGYSLALPTEAQWEYAARGGGLSRGYTYAGSDRLEEVGWFNENSYGESKPVGLKLSNELGLYDMSGNVWEWCSDWYGGYPESDAPLETDPAGPSSGDDRVLRGGGWFSNAGFCRCAFRYRDGPRHRFDDFGFRVALSASRRDEGWLNRDAMVGELELGLRNTTFSGSITIGWLRNAHEITSRSITQDFCFRSDDLKRRIVNLRNDLRSFDLGQKDNLECRSYFMHVP